MPEGLPWPPKKDDLERLYVTEGKSAMRIAEIYGMHYKTPKVGESTILYQLKRNGISRRGSAAHNRKVTEAMVDEWVRRYKSGESLKQIAGGTVSAVTVWNHLKGRDIKLRDRVEAQIQAVSRHERKAFLGDNTEKAYLMGLRYGDLDATRHGRAIRVRVSTTHPAMADLFQTLFSAYGFVRSYPREANFTGFEWTLEADLDQSFEFLLRKASLHELQGFSSLEFKFFLAGLFDAEGTLSLHRKRFGKSFEFCINSVDAILLDFIRNRLHEAGYHPIIDSRNQDPERFGYHKEGRMLRLSLFRRSEVCRILKEVQLRHPERLMKALLITLEFCSNQAPVREETVQRWVDLRRSIKQDRDEFVEEARLNLSATRRLQRGLQFESP